MTLNACILVKTIPLDTQEVLKKTLSLKGIRKAFVAYGRYDIVVFARTPGYPELRSLTGDLNSMKGVRSTETLVEA